MIIPPRPVDYLRQAAISVQRGRIARLAIWGAWGTLFALALVYTQRHAIRMPAHDDWGMLTATFSGAKPLTLERLWSQTHEHRLPLPQLIVHAIAWLTNGTLHVENFLNVVLLAALAAVLMGTARRVRGSPHLTDAFFPLALLHLGHMDLFLIRMTINHTLSAVLMGLALAILAAHRGPLGLRRTLLFGGLLGCLPLCGANGMPAVLAGAAWLIFGARSGVTSTPTGQRSHQWLHFAVAGALLGLIGLYFVNYKRTPHHPPPADLWTFLEACARAASVSFAVGGSTWWPWAGLVVPTLVLATVALLMWTWWQQPAERSRVLGLCCCMGAAVGVVIGLGWGRGGLGAGATAAPRYAIVTLPVLLTVYLCWVVHGSRLVRDVLPCLLLALLCWCYPSNWRVAHVHGGGLRHQDREMVRAVREGAPSLAVVQLGEWLFVPPRSPKVNAAKLLSLRDAGFYRLRELQADPTWHRTTLGVEPHETLRLERMGAGWVAQTVHPQLIFQLPEAQHVHAVRLRFRLPRRDWPDPRLRVLWREHGVNEFVSFRNHATYVRPADDRVQNLLIWVNARIDQLRIDPSIGPCEFELQEITLLRKVESDATAGR